MKKHAAILVILALVAAPSAYAQPSASGGLHVVTVVTNVTNWLAAIWDAAFPDETSDEVPPPQTAGEAESGNDDLPNIWPMIEPTG